MQHTQHLYVYLLGKVIVCLLGTSLFAEIPNFDIPFVFFDGKLKKQLIHSNNSNIGMKKTAKHQMGPKIRAAVGKSSYLFSKGDNNVVYKQVESFFFWSLL